jgi:hypothetical protein
MNTRLLGTILTAAACTALAHPALAVVVGGGIDPVTGLTAMLPYALRITGLGICGVGVVKGVGASFDGRSVFPAVGGVVGGMGLAFGAPYLMTQYGVL